MLKKSMYNYIHKTDAGDMLLCNFVKGSESFCKILKEDIPVFNAITDKDVIAFEGGNQGIQMLHNKGILVKSDEDEMQKIKALYYEDVMNDWLSLIIMPTEKCNFRCKYCYETYEKGIMTNAQQNALLKFIQKQIRSIPKLNLSWFGGEPLLALDVIEHIMEKSIKICDERKAALNSNMTTNGYFLNISTFDRLYNLKVRSYQITLDGLKEQHNKQRPLVNGGETYDRILKNLIAIRDHKEYRFAHLTIRINITQENFDKLDEFVEFYKKIFADDQRFDIRFAITGDYGGNSIEGFRKKLLRGDQIAEKLKKIGIFNDIQLNIADALLNFQPMNKVCYAALKHGYTIGSDLTVYRCSIHFDKPQNILGKIDDGGNLDIDTYLDNKWWLKEDSIPENCQKCFYLPCCFRAQCPIRMNFNIFERTCNIQNVKNSIGDYLNYLAKQLEFPKIQFV